MTRETFAVALVGEEAHGGLVDAESAGEPAAGALALD